MSGDPDGADARKSRQADGSGSVRNEVQEGTRVGENGTVSSQTVEDSAHTVLTDTVSDVSARVVTETSGLGLEVDSLLPAGQVGAGQIGGTTEELGDDTLDLGEDGLGQLSRGDGGVGGGVDGEALLPTLGKLAGQSADKVGVLLGVLLLVLGEELVPLLLTGGALRRSLAVEVVDLLGNGEALVGVETPLLLQLLDVISLERRTVDTVGALVEGAETNGGLELDKSRLVGNGLGLLDGSLDGSKVVVTVIDLDDVPAVSLISLGDVLGEGNSGVTVNGDLVVVPDGNEVAKLEVASQRASLAGDTLHQATIAEEGVSVVVDKLKTVLVEGGGSVSLSHGQTNSVGNTLAKRTSGDLNSGSVVSLGVTGSSAVNGL